MGESTSVREMSWRREILIRLPTFVVKVVPRAMNGPLRRRQRGTTMKFGWGVG